ncbi:unnamed protein product [Ilex paraguariensis]|uniref:Uncharacterized protein n=1 Tax=Ilex paraguariensis TaxID=185542 RepID=A0ABC8SAK0_9AQUA
MQVKVLAVVVVAQWNSGSTEFNATFTIGSARLGLRSCWVSYLVSDEELSSTPRSTSIFVSDEEQRHLTHPILVYQSRFILGCMYTSFKYSKGKTKQVKKEIDWSGPTF